MKKQKKEKQPPLEEGLLTAMRALDKQIAREMERSPFEREVMGVQKWDPYEKRIERVAAFVIEAIGRDETTLDSLIVCSQAFTKALQLIVSDLGNENLGQMRTAYCNGALENISKDADRALRSLGGESNLM